MVQTASGAALHGTLDRSLGTGLSRRKLLASGRECGWARNRSRDAHRFSVAQIGIERSDHDAGFDGDQVNAHQRDANPRVDDDAFVEDTIEDVDEAGAAWGSFNWGHAVGSPLSWSIYSVTDGGIGGSRAASSRSSSAMRCSRRVMVSSDSEVERKRS